MPLNFSNAYRWTRCASAGRETQGIPALYDTGELSNPRKEGRAAAWVADGVLRGDASCAADFLGELSPDGWTITPDMVDHVQAYITHVSSFGAVRSEASLEWYGITGRVDQHISSDSETLRIFDLKYGFRIVEPEDNEQLLLAAITLLKGHHRDVELTIFQPRPFHPAGPWRTWKITPADLMSWADFFRYRADDARLPNPGGRAGSYCEDCPFAGPSTCAALGIEIASRFESMSVDTQPGPLPAARIKSELDWLKETEKMINARRKATMAEASARARRGEFIPGMMLAEKYGHRKFTVPLTMVEMMTGVHPYRDVEMSPAELEREGVLTEIVNTISKPQFAGYDLVPYSETVVKRVMGDKST